MKKLSRAHTCAFKNISLLIMRPYGPKHGLRQFSVPWLGYNKNLKMVFLIPRLFLRLNFYPKGIFKLKLNFLWKKLTDKRNFQK